MSETSALDTARAVALAAYEDTEDITDAFDADPVGDAFRTGFDEGWHAAGVQAKAACTRPDVCTCACGSAVAEPAP